MNNVQTAIITPVLAAGSTTSPYFYSVNITQKLCNSACAENPPIFNPQFAVMGISTLGNNLYAATVRVQGIISYVPCGKNVCCSKTQTLSQLFTLPFTSETVPTSVDIESAGPIINSISTTACQTCSRTFVCDCPISLAVLSKSTTTTGD